MEHQAVDQLKFHVEQTDPLYLAPAALDPELAYQWFRISIHGEADESVAWRARGWSPVLRAAMPDEPTTGDTGIQRADMQLYCRPKAEAEAATLAAIEVAQSEYRAVEELCGRAPYSDASWQSKNAPAARTQWPPPPEPFSRSRWAPPPRWTERHQRGRLVTIHEESLNPRLARMGLRRFLVAQQYRLARWRVVYMPRDEAEMAERMYVSYADWAWSKIDLVCEGALPSGGARTFKTRNRTYRKR